MLKIKKNVDLKELEKFGFEKDEVVYNKFVGKTKKDFVLMSVFFVNNQIDIYVGDDDQVTDPCSINLDTLYDLIKADLVEKVEK